MIINNTHVQGIYIYEETLEYEVGDFVVDGKCIYICTAKSPTNTTNSTVSGQAPSEHPENFDTYLANKVASLEDYVNYVNGSSSEDKFISNLTLSSILQRQFFGLDDTGLIDSYIIYDISAEDDPIIYSSNLSEAISSIDTSASAIDRVLRAPTLNNGILKISTDLPELKNIFVSDLSSDNFIILRQYTYTNSSENYINENDPDDKSMKRYRVQELTDPTSGATYCRYSTGTKLTETDSSTGEELWEYNTASSWRTIIDKASNDSYDYQTNITQIKDYYSQTLSAITAEKEQLKNFYRSAVAWSTANINTQEVSVPFSDFGLSNTTISNSVPVHVTVGSISTINIYRMYTITVDLSDAVSGNINYYVSSNISLEVSISDYTVKFTLITGSTNCYLKDISYRKYYK